MIKRSDFDVWGTREVARLLALVETDRDRYQEMIALVPTPLVVVARGRAISWANKAFLRLVGLRAEDLRGKDFEQVLPDPGAVRITPIPLDDGEETMLVVEQATEAAAPPTARAERMDALQTVAGRLAHDLNNPLMIVTGYGEEVLQSLPADHALRKEIDEILAAAGRIALVAARLTEFARKNANPAQAVDVKRLLAGLEERVTKAAGVACTIDASTGPVWALADPGQLEQVILTLASRDLESAAGRSRLTVGCSIEGAYACISLRDDGRGLDAAKAATVFETGLTAKTDSPEARSGMALARAYNLVRQWGGDIEVRGSECRVYLLPRSESKVEPQAAAPPAKGAPAILVVDDEAGIRGLVTKFLRREGYRVVEAGSAEEALEVSRGQRVQMLVTDVMLPGMQGSELARKMYEANANLKVLYISGYTPDESVRSAAYPPGAAFLAKPFTLAALGAKVREALPQRLG